MPQLASDLTERLSEIVDLRNAAHVLGWDQQTMMPPRGGPARAEALATLGRITHELFVSADTGRLLEAAASELDGAGWAGSDSDAARIVDVTRRRWEKARLVPPELAADLVRAGSLGQEAWVLARRDSNFAAFAPYLETNYELARRYVECFDGFECAYDALLDDYDPGMRTRRVKALFDELKADLVPMIATLSERTIDDSCLHGSFPVEEQRRLVAEVIKLMGFNGEGWRMDDAVHPFATCLGAGDVRITTRWDDTYYASGLYGAMHECGHGLYEDGISDSLQRTPLGHGESLAIHESQSRMWENMVGRGRPFSSVLAPRIAQRFASAFNGSSGAGAADALYRAVNRVEPSLIRVEADEATYGLHIILRFELEQELIDGTLATRDVPEAWNARFKDYFGLDVTDDAHGALQDVHWSAGLIGYFPTYALGNLIAGQLWERVHEQVPDLDPRIADGDLLPLREWLRENVHSHGAKFDSTQLLGRVVGTPITVTPFLRYLKGKLGDVYGVDLSA